MNRLIYPVIASAAVLFVGVVISTFFELYNIPHFDKLMHFWGGFCAAWFFAVYFSRALRQTPPGFSVLAKVSFAGLVGIVWEIAEYASDVLSPVYFPELARFLYIGTLGDTLADLAADMAGAALLALIWYFKSSPES